MTVPIRKPGSGGTSIQVFDAVDFTGGLNVTDDWLKIGENETPDCLNVEFNSLGGFRGRRGVERVNTTAVAAQPTSVFRHGETDGTRHIMASINDEIFYSTGGDFTNTGATNTAGAGPAYGQSYNDKTWICRNAMTFGGTWDGSTFTDLQNPVGAWDPDYSSPSGNKMPLAKFACVQHDRMWVASTREGGVAFPNRVRFSFVGDPGSWREVDSISIDVGKDGDVITGMVAVSDHIVVFKGESMYAIYGDDATNIAVVTLRDGTGAVSQNAIAVGLGAAFFFDATNGLHAYIPSTYTQSDEDSSTQWLFQPLERLLRDDLISHVDLAAEACVGVIGSSVWVHLPSSTKLAEDYTWVLNTALGAWTKYDLKVGPFITWPNAGEIDYVAVQRNPAHTNGFVKLERDRSTDDQAGTDEHIPGHYVTGWYLAGSPVTHKRWYRPNIMVMAPTGGAIDLDVDTYKDFSKSVERTQRIELEADSTSGNWGDNWGFNWSSGSDGSVVHKAKANNVGRACAVAFRIANAPTQSSDWAVSSLTLKYRPQKVRR